MRRRLALTSATAVVVLMVFGVAGSSRLDGPIILDLSASHGVHLGDLPVLLVGAVAMVAIAWFARSHR